MNTMEKSTAECIERIRTILRTARTQALRTANAAMVSAYWHIGREIVEEEQHGQERADYGAQLIRQLSKRLTDEFGKGFGERNLWFIRQFYQAYRDRAPMLRYSVSAGLPPVGEAREILYTVSTEFDKDRRQPSPDEGAEILNTLGTESERSEISPLSPDLSWSHYRVLMRVTPPEARTFYEVEAVKSRWSVRELERQIGSLLFERLSKSRDKEGVMTLAQEGHEVFAPADLIKDPYVLEFTGLPEASRWLESDLEQALIDRLQQFILELGRDLFFVARQQRLTIDGDHFYVDLVFYHRTLRAFLLIDLKTGPLTQQDIGQMLLYTGWYESEERRDDEGPPIGLILCTSKNEAVVKYTLSQSASQVFASRYQLHLPSEEDLAEELRQERTRLEQQLLGDEDDEHPGG